MKKLVTMLRGINVSGQKPVKMPELKKLFESLGYHDVLTYIQSGNVIFRTDEDCSTQILSAKIGQAILDHFGFNVAVLLRTPEELNTAIQHNPFQNTDGSKKENIYITFLENSPLMGDIESIEKLSFLPDRFVIKGMEIYIDCAGGYGTTKLSNTFFEKKLKIRATTRNWKTLVNLMEIVNSE